MKASWRKTVGGYYGVALQDPLTIGSQNKRIVWACPDVHPKPRGAIACARKWIRTQSQPLSARDRARAAGRNAFRAATDSQGVPGSPLEFRRSYVESFLQCTEYQKDDGTQAAFGGLVHDAIQVYLRVCIAKREETRIKDIPNIVKEAIARHGGIHPDRYGEAQDMVEQFARTRAVSYKQLLWHEGVPCVEYKLWTEVDGFRYTGTVDRIDRMDGGDPYDPATFALITDYKTQWAKADHTFQGRFYCELLFRMLPDLEGVAVLFDHLPLRNGDVWHPGRVNDQIGYFERGDLTQWFDDIVRIFRMRYDGPRGHPVGNPSCQYCALRKDCAAAEMTAADKPENKEQARELVGDWIRATERASALKSALEAHYKNKKADVFNGVTPDPRPIVVGFLPPKKPKWVASDPEGIAGTLDKMGMDGKSIFYKAIDAKLIPTQLYDQLVTAGVARWDPGQPEFKKRFADGEDE